MSASTAGMINQLQQGLAVGQQPSFDGLSAPPDPDQLRGLLAKLQQQQALSQAGSDNGDPYSFLTAPSRRSATLVGQSLSNLLGGPGAAPAAPAAPTIAPPGAPGIPAPQAPGAPLTAQAQINAAIQQGRTAYQGMIAAKIPPDQAKVNTLKMLVQAGVPGADVALDKANTAVLENSAKVGQTNKDNAAAAASTDEISHRALDDKSKVFTDRPDLSNPEYMAQQDANGKITFSKRSDRASLPQTPEESANSDTIAAKIANYDLQMSDAVGRGNVQQRQDMLARVLKVNPDYDVKNFKQSQDALKAYGPSGVQGQLVLKTQNAMNHLHALQEWGKALKNGDSQAANAIGNAFARQFNDSALSTYDTVAPIVANEVSGAIVKGGGGVQERLARVKDFSDLKNDAARSGAITGAGSLLGAQYKNNQNLYEVTTLRKDFNKRFPIEGGFPAPPGTSTAPPPAEPSAGWGAVVKH